MLTEDTRLSYLATSGGYQQGLAICLHLTLFNWRPLVRLSQFQYFFGVQKGAEAVKKVNGIFLFKVKTKDNKEGVWVVDVKNGNGSVKFDSTGLSINYFRFELKHW